MAARHGNIILYQHLPSVAVFRTKPKVLKVLANNPIVSTASWNDSTVNAVAQYLLQLGTVGGAGVLWEIALHRPACTVAQIVAEMRKLLAAEKACCWTQTKRRNWAVPASHSKILKSRAALAIHSQLDHRALGLPPLVIDSAGVVRF